MLLVEELLGCLKMPGCPPTSAVQTCLGTIPTWSLQRKSPREQESYLMTASVEHIRS